MSLSLLSFYGQSKLSVVYSTIFFNSNVLSLSICRMASDDVTIWVKVEDGRRPRRATSLDISRTLTIDRLVTTALQTMKVDVAPDLVTVKFGEAEIEDSGLLVTEFTTGSKNPLLLMCPDDCEGV